MFVVILDYVKPLEEVDRLKAAHVAFLDAQYEKGHFIASGPRKPRTGGVILAQGMSREQLDAVLAEDPFQREGIAHYSVIEFDPTKRLEGFPA